MAKCKNCGKQIIWITLPNGRSHPFNLEEVAIVEDEKQKTKVLFTSDGTIGSGYQTGESNESVAWEYGRMSHMATCTGK